MEIEDKNEIAFCTFELYFFAVCKNAWHFMDWYFIINTELAGKSGLNATYFYFDMLKGNGKSYDW